MSQAQDTIAEVKEALACGKATRSTTTALQDLLALDDTSTAATSRPAKARPVSRSNEAKNVRSTTRAPRKTTKPTEVAVHEDRPSPISVKDRYALATEVTSLGLKVLSQAVTRSRSRSSTAKKTAGPSRHVLSQCSANATPSPPTSKAGPVPCEPRHTEAEITDTLQNAAECVSMALACLRRTDTNKTSAKGLPNLQLESAMASAAGKMLCLGMRTLTANELHALRKRLVQASSASSKPARGALAPKETLSSLMGIAVDPSLQPELLSIVITHQLLSLQLITVSHDAAAKEAAYRCTSMQNEYSLANLILSRAQQDPESQDGAIRQLQALSLRLLDLCPSTSADSDSVASDAASYPSPISCFEIHVLSLTTRRLWWELAKHSPDFDREIIEPLRKALTALQRRSKGTTGSTLYAAARSAYDRLGLRQVPPSRSRFHLHSILSNLAKKATVRDDIKEWNEQLLLDADDTTCSSALRTMAQLRNITSSLQDANLSKSLKDLASQIEIALSCNISGNRPDYDMLLAEVALSVQTIVETSESQQFTRALEMCSKFAQRYYRSYPSLHQDVVRGIILSVFVDSKGKAAQWIDSDTVSILIGSGILAEIAQQSDQVSWDAVWAMNRIAVTLDQSLLALLQKYLAIAATNQESIVYGDDGLEPLQRAILLEKYLAHCIDLSASAKYHEPLVHLLPHLLQRIQSIELMKDYPVRCTRVNIMVSQLRELGPNIDDVSSLIHAVDIGTLQECTPEFSRDLTAAWTVSQAFAEGHPTVIQLKTPLTTWHDILSGCKTRESLQKLIYDTKGLHKLLQCCSTYLAALGENSTQLTALQCISKLSTLADLSIDENIKSLLDQSHVYINLLQSELAGQSLALAQKVASRGDLSPVSQLQLDLSQAEYYIAIERLDKAKDVLQSAAQIRSSLEPKRLSRPQRLACQRQHAQAWLLQSILLYKDGSPHDALIAGRRCFKLLNSEWSAQEQRQTKNEPKVLAPTLDSSSFELDILTKGVSKLDLRSKTTTERSPGGLRCGSAFWSLIPILSQALLHVSTLCAHHGSFPEADWFSQRALRLSEDANASGFVIRAYLHRTTLFCLAGRVEDAELCAEKARQQNPEHDQLLTLLTTLAEASVREVDGSYLEASPLYEQARNIISRLETREQTQPADVKSSVKSTKRAKPATKSKTTTVARMTPNHRTPAVVKAQVTGTSRKPGTKAVNEPTKCQSLLIEDLKTQILLKMLTAAVRSSPVNEDELKRLQTRCQSVWQALEFRHVQFRGSMSAALTTLLSDFALNVLPESTLALPSILHVGQRPAEQAISQCKNGNLTTKGRGRTKPVAPVSPTAVSESFHAALIDAETRLLTGLGSSMQFGSTATTYLESNMLSQATIYRAAVASSKHVSPLMPALYLEQPRIKAAQYGAATEQRDPVAEEATSAWSWPDMPADREYRSVTAEEFAADYIQILPEPWTVLSLTMNEDCTEMFVVRYRRGMPPFTLRLPLTRPEGDQGEDSFDYSKVKEEFEDIITQSNFSCHNSGDVSAKGAKSRWWSERQALDQRLQDLVVNLENLWFGGFRGILKGSQVAPHASARFARQLENILDTHLPSRRVEQRTNSRFRLDPQVIELFTSLAADEEAAYDVDEALADLLYFVVDMLQFSGERNAYDEIDFDRMTVAVSDALRVFHEDNDVERSQDQHIVLVLEKRLQSLPWENLPSLENTSVSRVGSMFTLRECILAAGLDSELKGPRRHVDSHSGTYILNPSGDLVGTRDMLEPALLTMPGDKEDDWTSIVNRAPSETEFSEALASSKILLYFGHGAGSQYIRPRSVKKLDKCSEVVWLMGCSSGAVTEYGQLEPSAIPLTYLQAGESSHGRCLSIVATLWDVTDKDIDRFSLATGERWGLWPASESAQLPTKTPQKRTINAEPTTPKRPPKTPKTPKVHKTPVPPTTPRASSRNRPSKAEKMSLTAAVADSREVCYLRYLNGAAPVVYGIPVYLGE